MPLERIMVDARRAWAIWKVTESEDEAASMLPTQEAIPHAITHHHKRLEWLIGRILTAVVMAELGLKYTGIRKDNFGKPFPNGVDYQMSLSHSYPYIAVLIDASQSVGIDLEQPKQKLLRIASRVLSADELNDAGSDVIKHCIYWCAKEVLIKIHGRKDLVLAESILISPFERQEEGNITGRLIVNDRASELSLYYSVTDEFVMVFNESTEISLAP